MLPKSGMLDKMGVVINNVIATYTILRKACICTVRGCCKVLSGVMRATQKLKDEHDNGNYWKEKIWYFYTGAP